MHVEAKSLGHSSPIVPIGQLPVSGSGKEEGDPEGLSSGVQPWGA